ncbi:interferon-induced protein 44-like [Clarias gariepinus]|uniref:interferon-induced protein 44-like n=1 Tax=Clarias gariepinus TaxID=13013 RepID=UPI00234C9EB0|nr:interferon-induced protein 44-like [Clarias gariepinus]
MASIASSLSAENEVTLQKSFSSRVCFHLLYKSSHHGATIDQLLSRFDKHGKYLLIAFLKLGSVRGAFMSKPLTCGKEYSDDEMFFFKMETHHKVHDRQITPVNVDSSTITFGNKFILKLEEGFWYGSYWEDVRYGRTWPQYVYCIDVELHRVQDLGDILPKPWREVLWSDETRENLRQDFVSYKPFLESLPQIKALLLGPVGSGKSNFISSIKSTMYKRIVHLPNVGSSVEGFTKKMTTYDIRVNQRGSQSALSLCDVMALGNDDSTGLSYNDALAVIKGHVPEGYEFQKGGTISDIVSGYIANPSLNEQIHCVLFILDATKLTSYPSSLESTLRKLHSAVSNLGIPQLILLTHVDQVSLAVQKDLSDVYYSLTVQNKMKKAGEMVGLPLSYVLPVTNYVSQLTVDCNTDILLLNVGMSILQAADDAFED